MSEVLEKYLTISNQKGLHARAAAAFVKCVAEFDADITVEKEGKTVDGSSILSLMMLAAAKGCQIKVTATGNDAKDAISAISNLVTSRFGEDQ